MSNSQSHIKVFTSVLIYCCSYSSCMCVYTYIYACIYIYIHVHIYIHNLASNTNKRLCHDCFRAQFNKLIHQTIHMTSLPLMSRDCYLGDDVDHMQSKRVRAVVYIPWDTDATLFRRLYSAGVPICKSVLCRFVTRSFGCMRTSKCIYIYILMCMYITTCLMTLLQLVKSTHIYMRTYIHAYIHT